jgi:hypothetical protein
MTQPGASKHPRVLREVGLVRDRKAGKLRRYGLDARGLRPAHEWTGLRDARAGRDGLLGVDPRWTEIAPPERIMLRHGEFPEDPNAFESVLTFDPDGAATRLEMRTVFPTKEMRDEAVVKYHAIEAGEQTLAGLAAYVTGLASGVDG